MTAQRQSHLRNLMRRKTLTSKKREIWMPIAGWPHYEVSSDGRVKSFHNCQERILKQWVSTSGYMQVGLHLYGKKKTVDVHRVVCIAFNGKPDDGYETAHLDGNKLNNAAENLAWVTHTENCKHRNGHGTHRRGSDSPLSKMTERDVADARKMYEQGGVTYKDIGRRYGVSPVTAWRNVKGLRWRHV